MKRKLKFENLEPRLMLSASFGFHKDILVDGSYSLSSRPLYANEHLGLTHDDILTTSLSKTRNTFGGNSEDLNGILLYPDDQPRYRAVFVNGGKASSHGYGLGEAGRENYVKFYENGGSYTGSCAGAFLAADFMNNYLGIYPGYMSCCRGRGYDSADFSETENEFFKDLGEVKSIRYIGSPIFKEHYRHPEGTEFIGETSKGQPYIIAYKENDSSGRAVLQPWHPEYYSSGPRLELMSSVLRYALDGARKTPDIKGSLELEDIIDAIVGDGQYHIWSVESIGADLDISVSNIEDVELFVSFEGFAHKNSFEYTGDTVFIDNPEIGTYYVSVFGDHDILNGEKYSLAVNTDLPEILEPEWTFVSTNKGRITEVDGWMRMDSSVNRQYSLNEAIVKLDGYSSILINHRRARDEYTRLPKKFTDSVKGDGVSLSQDGVIWYRSFTWNGVIDVGSYKYLKVQQYDNYVWGPDGREWKVTLI